VPNVGQDLCKEIVWLGAFSTCVHRLLIMTERVGIRSSQQSACRGPSSTALTMASPRAHPSHLEPASPGTKAR
jgi:hypothetical protein